MRGLSQRVNTVGEHPIRMRLDGDTGHCIPAMKERPKATNAGSVIRAATVRWCTSRSGRPSTTGSPGTATTAMRTRQRVPPGPVGMPFRSR